MLCECAAFLSNKSVLVCKRISFLSAEAYVTDKVIQMGSIVNVYMVMSMASPAP
jgi:hypothetical protein